MRAVWRGEVPEPFVVRDVQGLLSRLAYTTLMTTVNRLAEKGLLAVEQIPRQKAYSYRKAGPPEEFLGAASRLEASRLRERYGDAALVAFAAELEGLSTEQRERLRRLGSRE